MRQAITPKWKNVASSGLADARREGAELKAWVVAHGFASLAIDGLVAAPSARARAAALEDALDFAVVGLCGEAPGARRMR